MASKKKSRFYDRISIFSAILISLIALVTSIEHTDRQAKFNRETLELTKGSLLPIVTIDYQAFIDDTGGAYIHNIGNGPALMDSIMIFYADTLVNQDKKRNMSALRDLLKIFRNKLADIYKKNCFYLYEEQMEIGSNKSVQLFGISPKCKNINFYKRSNELMDGLELRVYYHTMWGDTLSCQKKYK